MLLGACTQVKLSLVVGEHECREHLSTQFDRPALAHNKSYFRAVKTQQQQQQQQQQHLSQQALAIAIFCTKKTGLFLQPILICSFNSGSNNFAVRKGVIPEPRKLSCKRSDAYQYK